MPSAERRRPTPKKNVNQKRDDRQRSRGSNDVENVGAVLADHRVVLKAEQEHLVDDRAELALRGVQHAEPQILRRVVDSVEVARDLAVGRQQHAVHVTAK